MNLRESMLAAAEDAPLAESTVDVDRIVRQGRRANATRRSGAVAVALAAVLVVPALVGGRDQATRTQSTVGPPVVGGTTTAPPVLVLTAAELAAAMSGDSGVVTINVLRRWPVGQDPFGGGDPCVLPAGATPGRDFAPAPEDRCTRVEVRSGSKTVWVRRWGYSPTHRPWTTPDTVVVELFFPVGGRPSVLVFSNQPLDGRPAGWSGPKFEISDDVIRSFLSRIP